MAEFLTTEGVSDRLVNIIREAKEFILLISPYVDVSDRLKERIEDTEPTGIKVSLIYGKKQKQRGKEGWFTTKKWINTYYYEKLHAKCYLNESKALLTSMNLVEYSQTNNREIGMLVSLDEEPAIYEQILTEAESIKSASKVINVSTRMVKAEDADNASSDSGSTRRKPRSQPETLVKGYCIQCRTSVDFDWSKPLCGADYWAKGRTGIKNFCHKCSQPHRTSLKRPLCESCHRAA